MKAIKEDISRLVLGTAQLGMDYGIANANGRPVYNTARSIVQEAWESGICEFHTGPGLCPIAESAYESIISLPMFPGMSDEDVEQVVTCLKKATNKSN